MELKTAEKIYVSQLKEIYSVEKQLLDILPKVIRGANNKFLKTVLKEHLEQTKLQAERIQKIFQHLSHYKPMGEHSNVMEGFIDELEDLIDDGNHSDTLDAELILVLQKIEHYEVACYAAMVTYARILGHEQASEMLQESLDEEYEADNKLDKLNEEIITGAFVKHV